MSWFKRALEEVKDISGDYLGGLVKSVKDKPLENLLTGGMYAQVESATNATQKEFSRYADNNGGKQARATMAAAEIQAGLDADTQKNNTIASESKLASSRYGSGGDAFTSLTNSSVANPAKKKSILGGF